jgi:putative membrane protein
VDILNSILFWIHLVALAVGGAAVFGIPMTGAMLANASVESRSALVHVIERLSRAGRGAIGTLLVTGPLMVWLKYRGFADLSAWFWIKMVLVVIMVAGVIYAGLLMRRAATGDAGAVRQQPMVGTVLLVTFVCIILSAVLAFG